MPKTSRNPGRRRIFRAATGAALALLMIAIRPDPGIARAAAALPAQNPEPVASARVTDVVDGDTIVLDSGAEVRLTGIQAPKLPLGRRGFRAWPLAEAAKAAMVEISHGRRVSLSYSGATVDRWGRLLAQVRAGDVWLQQDMLRRGLARVYTFADNREHAAVFYAAERDARRNRRGIWALDWYRILEPGGTGRHIGSFQIVEGRPAAVAIAGGTAYLNFGADWRTDFTASISKADMKLFRRAGVDVRGLEGKRLRLRGWLIRRNGPMIKLTHPEQIEVLDP